MLSRKKTQKTRIQQHKDDTEAKTKSRNINLKFENPGNTEKWACHCEKKRRKKNQNTTASR